MERQRRATVNCGSLLVTFVCVFLLSDYFHPTSAASLSLSASRHRTRRQYSNTRLTHGQQLLLNQAPYLARMGYLSNGQPDASRSGIEDVTAAIRKFQQIANISQTGLLDTRTTRKMSEPRCGMPDANIARSPGDPQNYELMPSKWNKHHIKWSVDNDSPDMDRGTVRSAISQAFNLWRDVSALTFQEVHRDDSSDIRLSFARGDHRDGFPFDGPGRTLAHAFAPGEMQGGDVHFDDDETWTARTSTGTNLYTVAAHELGHSLGISHSKVVGALMYPYYAGYDPNLRLHEDDIAAIQVVYGAPTRTNVATTRPSATLRTTLRSVTQSARATSPPVDAPPNPCTAKVHAVSYIRREIFVFKGKWFWRLNYFRVITAYPVLISDFWTALPRTVNKVDAVVERPYDGVIIFFIGERYYELRSNTELASGFPSMGRAISSLTGLPSSSSRLVDAAFVWPNGYERTMYITIGYSYFRLTSRAPLKVDGISGSVRSLWPTIPLPLDAAFTHPSGHAYFFKDSQIWKFNTTSSTGGSHLPLRQLWPQCPENIGDTRAAAQLGPDGTSNDISGAQNSHVELTALLWPMLLALVICNRPTIRITV